MNFKKTLTILLLICAPLGFSKSYNVDEFLGLVKEHSKDLKLAEKEQEVAKANKKQAISIALPKVNVQGGYTRNLTDYYMYADFGSMLGMFGIPSSGEPAKFKVNRTNEYSANVAVQQTLFSPSVGNALRAAKEYQKITDFAYEAGEQAVLTGAKKMYYQALLLEKVCAVNEAAELNAKENYDNMKLKFDNGVISEFELLQSQVRWKNAIPQTAESKRNLELLLNNMRNWAGLNPDEELELGGEFSDIPAMPDDFELESVLERRPDFQAMNWEQKLRKTNVRAQKMGFLPTLSGTFAYNYSAQSDEFQLDMENELYMASVNLSMPIFTGGYRTSEIQKAQIELDKTRIKMDQTKENIYNELSNIYLRLREAHQRISSAETILTTAEKAFTIAEHTAESGLATQLQLKDARVGFDQAHINYYAAIFDYLNAYFDWEQASGRL